MRRRILAQNLMLTRWADPRQVSAFRRGLDGRLELPNVHGKSEKHEVRSLPPESDAPARIKHPPIGNAHGHRAEQPPAGILAIPRGEAVPLALERVVAEGD